jgi:hypothetical protein
MARKTYEGSKQDIREDVRGARKMGVTMKAYERTAKDKAEDKRGQLRLTGKRRGGRG